MKRKWTKKLLAGVLSLALAFTAAFAVSPQILRAGAAQAANTADVPQNQVIAGQNLGIQGNENRLMRWDYNPNTTAYLNTFTGNYINQFRIAGTPFALTYNSLDPEKKFFGTGVSSIFDQSIKKFSDNAYEFTEADGGKRYFTRDNNWQDGYGNSLAFTDRGYTVHSENRSLTFDNSGKLISLEQPLEPGGPTTSMRFYYEYVNSEGNLMLSSVLTKEFGTITFVPTKEGDSIDGKDIQFERMPEGYDPTFVWYYSGIMDFGDIRNTDGTSVMTSRSEGLGKLYDYNHTMELTPEFPYGGPRIPSSVRHRDNAVNLDSTWEFTYGDRRTTITNPDGSQTVQYFDIWGNPTETPEPDTEPSVPTQQIAQDRNLGYNRDGANSYWKLGTLKGNVQVNLYNGNVFFETNQSETGYLTYNSQSTQTSDFGDRFSYRGSDRIDKISDDVYVLTDVDGQRHYFTYDNTPGALTDDRGYTLTIHEDTYTIKDNLYPIGTYSKDTGRNISVVLNEDGTTASFELWESPYTLGYYPATASRGPRVQSVSQNGVSKATFGYNAQGNPTAMILSDGSSILLTYDSTGTLLTGIQNIADNSRIQFGYITDENGLPRANNVQQFDASGAKTNEVTIAYGKNAAGNRQTMLINMQGVQTVYNFDEYGDKM